MSYIVTIKYSGKVYITIIKASSRKSAKATGVAKASKTIPCGVLGSSPAFLPSSKIYSGCKAHGHKLLLKRAKKIGAIVGATPCPGATALPKPGFIIR